MGKNLNIVSSLHKKTKRNYLSRMKDNKVFYMKLAKKYQEIIGMVREKVVMEDIFISKTTGGPLP